MSAIIECKLLNSNAKVPRRATSGSAGFDLCGCDAGVNSAGVGVINTGIALQIPPNHVGIIMARSSYAFKYGMQILAGVIDSDYRDEIKILYKANGDFVFTAGERCAQIIIMPFVGGGGDSGGGDRDNDNGGGDSFTVVDAFTNDDVERVGGFGSTGV
jgi:dUTP pyrophosphatase